MNDVPIACIIILRAIRNYDVHNIHHICAGASSSVTGQTSRVMAAVNGYAKSMTIKYIIIIICYHYVYYRTYVLFLLFFFFNELDNNERGQRLEIIP